MYRISAFYKFTPIEAERLPSLRDQLTELAQNHELVGLLILSTEGFNGTIAAPAAALKEFLAAAEAHLNFSDVLFKESVSELVPFPRCKVVIRKELITYSSRLETRPSISVEKAKHQHLSPQEWQALLGSGEDVLIVDTRNEYEWQLGSFKGAVKPPIKKFSELPSYLENSDLPKNKKTLIFCTGGIRCEKAIFEFERQGFEEVYQLDGGILHYLETFPYEAFEGECFVFDHRVAVTQNLDPSQQYKLCSHCGDPGRESIVCGNCRNSAVICERCLKGGEELSTCSKNCAHHFARRKTALAVGA